MLEPMDIDTEIPRKSLGPPDRRSRGRPRQSSIGPASAAARTPKTVVREDVGTQTRRFVRVRRKEGDGEPRTAARHPDTPASPKTLKRKLFGSPGAEPVSPGLGGNRSKVRRIMESPPRASVPPRARKSSMAPPGRKSRSALDSPARARKSSIAPPGRKSRSARNSTRASAAPPARQTLEGMTVRQLKNLLAASGIDTSDCLEKQELVQKAQKHGLSNPVSGRPSVSAKSTPVIEPVPIPAPSLANGTAPKRHSRKHSGCKVNQTALMEIARIEEVSSKSTATSFDILGVSRMGASEASVRSRAKQLFRYVHPDKIQDEEIKRRAHNVFQLINQAVDESLKQISVSGIRDPPKPVLGIKYTVERAGTVVLLRWKPDKSAESFRVFASIPTLHRSGIDQGTVANLTGDNGELEYAISAQSRAGNDELFRRGKFEVSIVAINSAGESTPISISIDLSRPNSVGGLKRHHTIC